MENKVLDLLREKKYQELHTVFQEMNSADIAQQLEDFESGDLATVYRLLSKETAAETFAYLDTDMKERLIHTMTDKELNEVISRLFLDDTVDLVEEMPANVVKRILKTADPSQRQQINELLNYPSDSAGSVMTTEFVDFKAGMTVEEAFTRIRKTGVNKETIYTCYVLDDSRRLIGIVTVKDLLLAEPQRHLSDIMETNLITVHTLEDQEEAVRKFNKYDLLALPVVDNEGRMVGIITIDDAVDVLQEENTEDFEKMAAMNPTEDTYFRTSVFRHARNRIVWLLVLMLSATVTGMMTMKYEAAFSTLPLLVAFIPMLTDTGGNCGSQSATLIIRGMAVEEIHMKDFFRVLWKEIRVAGLVGIVLALVNGARILLQYHNAGMAVVIGLTLLAVVMMSKVLGCILPMAAKKLKLDPAMMAAPLITTIVDTCSLLIYFNIAIHLLNLE